MSSYSNIEMKKIVLIQVLLLLTISTFCVDVKSVVLDYYYLPGCKSCQEFIDITVPKLEENLGIDLILMEYDILDQDTFKECEERLAGFGKILESYPVIFTGNQMLQGDEIELTLSNILINIRDGKFLEPTSNKSSEGSGVKLSILPVLAAGLVDGVNPCAFSILIFLIATLAMAGKGKKEILLSMYNIGFILPLLLVFGLTLTGVSSQKLTDVFKKNMGKVKLALGSVFIVLAVLSFVG